MRYMLKENIDVDFGILKQFAVADRIGIHKVTLSNIVNRKQSTTKAIAFYITYLCGGNEADIEEYFEVIKKGE